MNSLTDLEPQLANMHAFWLGYGREFHEDGEIAAYRSGVHDPALNGVLTVAEGWLEDDTIERARDRMAGVPWIWWVGSDSARGLASRLAEHGARRIAQVPIMSIELDKVARLSAPSRLEIGEITKQDGLDDWVPCWAPSMGVAADQVHALAQLEQHRLATAGTSMVRFTGRIDGEIVGSAALVDVHGVAGIYIVTCAERHRRRGIGAAMTAAALQAGRERGLRFGTLQATEAGLPVYERMGFTPVTEFQIFMLPSD